jgi:uncharacterized protein YegP (UPF0339 family)
MTIGRRRVLGAAAGAVAGTAIGTARAAAVAQLTFEIYADAKQEYRWRLKAANGQVIATSGQGYKAKADCRHGIEVIQEGASTAKIEELAAKK